VQVECNVRFFLVTGFWFVALMMLIVLCPERSLKARHCAEPPGSQAALCLPGKVACLDELVAMLVLWLVARLVLLLGESEPTLYPSQFDAVLGLALLPGAKGTQR
jgi:hypothetical protein